MVRLIRISVVWLAAFAIWPVIGAAQEFGPDCFRCESAHIGGTDYHEDERRPWEAGLLGDFHSNWTVGLCGAWLGDGHENYGLEDGGCGGIDCSFASAVKDGSDDAILKVLLEHRTIQLNVARGALQLTAPYGHRVLYHAPLDRAQVDRLQGALASMSASGDTGILAQPSRSKPE